ncbi:MAG TPA: ABC transporter substrate-binding protein [Deltaproteobacteria bacterium]|nr:ABC transporter substrate-binding protein [Deltaproteobacteria bacterium]
MKGRVIMKKCSLFIAVAMALLLLTLSTAHAGEKLRVGVLKLTSSAPIFIAVEKGFFKEQGLDIEQVFFRSAQPVAVAMASGDIVVGATGITAGLYNAIAGGFKMKIVADKGREWEGYQLCGIMVSKKAWDKGLRTIKDLKGHRVGVTQIGSTFHYMLGNMLEKNGMTLKDVKVTPLGGVKSMMDTVASDQIETAFMVQPFCSVMEAKKMGHRMLWVSDYLNYQIAVIFFGDTMTKDRKTSDAFMRAYIKGCRCYYDNCLKKKDGKTVRGPYFDEVMQIISKYTGRKPKLIAMGLNYNDRNGRLYAEDIQHQIDWYYDHGLIGKRLDARKIVDISFWERAMKELGLKP